MDITKNLKILEIVEILNKLPKDTELTLRYFNSEVGEFCGIEYILEDSLFVNK